ncbi:MAG: hypothetical protein GF408_01940 [Candidatus Omnitrophica bacterium]|nr:hypothetical protein [Candidatus Omnitrophota bacterium]
MDRWKELNGDVVREVRDVILERFGTNGDTVLVAVGGPGGTGKSTFSRALADVLRHAEVLKLDDYKTERESRRAKGIYGPHPEANEMDLVHWHIEDIKNKRIFFKPIYDPRRGGIDLTEAYQPARFNIIDGEISTYERFMEIIDFSVYIDAAFSTQLNTRLTRDIKEKGYTLQKALATFFGSNVREFLRYGTSGRDNADIILFCNSDYSLEVSEKNSRN